MSFNLQSLDIKLKIKSYTHFKLYKYLYNFVIEIYTKNKKEKKKLRDKVKLSNNCPRGMFQFFFNGKVDRIKCNCLLTILLWGVSVFNNIFFIFYKEKSMHMVIIYYVTK